MKNLVTNIGLNPIRPDGAALTVAAGVTTVFTDPVSSKKSDSIGFLLLLGAMVAGAILDITPQYSVDDGANWVDYPDTVNGGSLDYQYLAANAANKLIVIEVDRPQNPAALTRLKIARTVQNTTILACISFCRGGRNFAGPLFADGTYGNFDHAAAAALGTLDGNTLRVVDARILYSPALTAAAAGSSGQ